MKKAILIFLATIVFFLIVVLISFYLYKEALKPVGGSHETVVTFEVTSGSTYTSLVDDLYEKKLIRSKVAYRIYLRLHEPVASLQPGIYDLNSGMSVEEIIETLGGIGKPIVSITIPEGKNIPQIAAIIAKNTNHTEEEVYDLLKNEDYLRKIMEQYWFLQEDILDENIYYPLEGYLAPDTYYFDSKDVAIEDIFASMLDQMAVTLEEYEGELERTSYSVHEILTLASMVELEAVTADDRKMVAGIFYNRLQAGMSLGSDVTTYYGAQVPLGTRDLLQAEIEGENAYNTRTQSMAGKLPVGPICNPSKISIRAVLHPTESSYYFFVFDKNGKAYYHETNDEHEKQVQTLKENDLWIEFPS